MLLIDDLLLWGPMEGILALARKVQEIAEREIVDDVGKLKAELQEAQMLFEMDEIVEEEYTRREKDVLRRLDALQDAAEATHS